MYIVNGESFETKTALLDAIRTVFRRYLPGETLDQADTDFMFDVLMMHPDAETKAGCGIESFSVQFNPVYRNKEFHLHRKDGTSTDFSFKKCVSPPTHRARFLMACRQSIAPGIIAYRKTYFKVTVNPVCILSGDSLTPSNCHVDHEPPHTFRLLAEKFTNKYRVNMDGVHLSSGGDNNYTVLMPPDLEQLWTDFHWRHAHLRVISAAANLRLGRGEDLAYSRPHTEAELRDIAIIRQEMFDQGWRLLEEPLDKVAS